jgi:hypothetical protein
VRACRLTSGLHMSAAVSFPRTLSFHLPLPLPSGARLSVPVACSLTHPLSVFASRARPVSTMNCFAAHPLSPSLHRGTALSAPPSPRTAMDQRACTPISLATSPAHAPQLPFEPRSHPHSLPCPISRKLTLSRALLSPASPEFCARRADHPTRQKPRQAVPR